MILNISDETFKRIFSNEKLYLPIRWDNKDFVKTLKKLYEEYLNTISQEPHQIVFGSNECNVEINNEKIEQVCNLLVLVIEKYLDGFPADAFQYFGELMRLLNQKPLRTYKKSITEHFENVNHRDTLDLFRITCVNENIPYDRSRVFHTPYCLRFKVSTSRYSIAGFPSLYLGTSLELCREEVHYNPHEQFALASRFQIERNHELNNIDIEVIELAIKPQDFFEKRDRLDIYRKTRIIPENVLKQKDLREAYLLWFPLIAACSFIRVNKKDPFAVEYIIPQLLMQWVRSEIGAPKRRFKRLIGIRYFSCASVRSSDMGFNYVFPASGKHTKKSFCPTLSRAFKFTKPYFLHEYNDIKICEQALRDDNDLDFV